MRVFPAPNYSRAVSPFRRSTPFALVLSVLSSLCLAVPSVHGQAAAAPDSPVKAKAVASSAMPAQTGSASAPGHAQERNTAARKPGGPHEGIKVHGHWIIEVKNPDGTVTEHRDFENSLITTGEPGTGQQTLVMLLSGNAAVTGWNIYLASESGAAPCAPNNTENIACIVPATSTLPSGTSLGAENAPSTLTLSATISPVPPGGTCPTVGATTFSEICQSGTIDLVQTEPGLTAVSNNAISGTAYGYYLTSASDQTSPPAFQRVQVSAGQTVSVTVTLSFQ